MNSYFSLSDTVYSVTERYPEILDLLAANGFENLRNEMMRKTIGKAISLENALQGKHFDTVIFEQKMVEAIEENRPSLTTGLMPAKNANASAEVTVAGILPCPIRVQLLEKLEEWLGTQSTPINYDLQAASMGLDWLREQVAESEDATGLADVYLSAGFSLFFDEKLMGKHRANHVFADLTGMEKLNACFDNDYINLKDPLKQYSIIGVVPAIFMVNKEMLGNRPFPHSWADLLTPDFENTIALPMRDLDLFNAVLLGIYQAYGEEGVAKLGRALQTDMHPAQMIKSGATKQKKEAPVITVMPYFFTWMAKENGPMEAVWPKDGAIVSPIFLLTKAQSQEKIQPLVDFLCSKEMGNVLSANGKFPSTHPAVDNHLSDEQKFLWPGWDFIHTHDIGELLKETERIFLQAAEGKQ